MPRRESGRHDVKLRYVLTVVLFIVSVYLLLGAAALLWTEFRVVT